jgi:hypothetical protein
MLRPRCGREHGSHSSQEGSQRPGDSGPRRHMLTTERGCRRQSEQRPRFASFEPLWRDPTPRSMSEVGARSSAGSEQQGGGVTCRAPSLPQEGEPCCALRSPTDRRSSGASGLSWSAARSTWPLPTTSTTTAKSKPTPPLVQHGPAPASSASLRLGQHRAGRDTARATTRTPAVRLPTYRRALRPSPGSDTADAGTRHRTLRTGHWTPGQPDAHTGTGDWTPHRTLDTPRADIAHLDAGRSHRTLDAGRAERPRTRTGWPGTAGTRTSWATTAERRPAGTLNSVPVDGAGGARQP